ncbi:riboflavin kinase, putative, partial [Trypanosoma cruzi]
MTKIKKGGLKSSTFVSVGTSCRRTQAHNPGRRKGRSVGDVFPRSPIGSLLVLPREFIVAWLLVEFLFFLLFWFIFIDKFACCCLLLFLLFSFLEFFFLICLSVRMYFFFYWRTCFHYVLFVCLLSFFHFFFNT